MRLYIILNYFIWVTIANHVAHASATCMHNTAGIRISVGCGIQ